MRSVTCPAENIIIIFRYKRAEISTHPRLIIPKKIGHCVVPEEVVPESSVLHHCSHDELTIQDYNGEEEEWDSENELDVMDMDGSSIIKDDNTVLVRIVDTVVKECHNLWRRDTDLYVDPWFIKGDLI